MLSLAELARVAAVVERDWAGARVDRVVQPDPRRIIVSLHRHPADLHLLLCAEPASARAAALASRPAAPPAPPAFAQLLRARIGGGRLASAAVWDADRQLALAFDAEGGAATLLLSLLGPRSNLYLLDAERRVVGALRPLAETRRDLALGAPWRSPPSRAPATSEDRFATEPDAQLLAAIESAAAEREAAGEQQSLALRIGRALRRGASSIEKKLALLDEDAAAGRQAAVLRAQGELLKGTIGGVRRGAREVRVADPATGSEVVIALDPALAPRANLDAIFTRARKAEKRAERALRERGEAEARRDALAAVAAAFEALPEGDADALAAFAERPEVARLLGRFAAEPSAPSRPEEVAGPKRRVWRLGKQELPARLAPRVYRSSTGLEIWVGRSDEGNDLLSTRLARGKDLFFHLDASPGSHVVLRTEGRSDPPSEALLEAAELAVHFSRHRKVTEAHVLVAPIKNVSKPRGAKPGLVHVTGGRMIRLRRDAKRLERTLGSREEGSDDV
jgi:predicted ribosome quality control (RQC) complex YloA/Tae2 family protein